MGKVIASAVSQKPRCLLLPNIPVGQNNLLKPGGIRSNPPRLKSGKSGENSPGCPGYRYSLPNARTGCRRSKRESSPASDYLVRQPGCGNRGTGFLGSRPPEMPSTAIKLPRNFTASKLKWVKDHEPELFHGVHKFMLPGDYIPMRMSGEIQTTPSGLSEGILWDFSAGSISQMVLDHYGIPAHLIPEVVDTFSIQGELTREAASELGLRPGTKVSYRAGDQPNNALSLKVLNSGEMAATAGPRASFTESRNARCTIQNQGSTPLFMSTTLPGIPGTEFWCASTGRGF